VSALALKLASLITTLGVLAGSYAYVLTHVKNPNAPLQPAVAEKTATMTPSPTSIPSLVGTRRGIPARPSSSPAPLLDLRPGVQATALPAVTFTHVS
jgi:hypothetical protein